jgi:hypothetical protein
MPNGTVLDALRSWIDDAERELATPARDSLRQRIELLDGLESHLLDPSVAGEPTLHHRVMALRSELETASQQACDTIRAAIRRGDGPTAIAKSLTRERMSPNATDDEGYDYLDEILAGVLALDEPGPTTLEADAEMVFYQPTPARHILDLFDRASLTAADVLIDLGAGLGHVALMTGICTPARSIGVELEPSYVACARRAAAALNLKSVAFVEDDARAVALDNGTVFFLYTPFSGAMLRTMLDRLRRRAETHAIRVCTYGPCTATIAAEPWLVAESPVRAGRVAIFRSRTS